MGLLLAFIRRIKSKTKKRGLIVRGGREVCLDDESWQTRRKETHDRAGGRCERISSKTRCGRIAPIHDIIDQDYGDVTVPAGHAHHKNGTRGLGGGKRDDSLGNLEWDCWWCHRDAHTPKKVVPKKESCYVERG